MGDEHRVRRADVEVDTAKKEKLDAFRERAKQMNPGSPVHRVYAMFDNLQEFTAKAIHSVADLRRYLDESGTPSIPPPSPEPFSAAADPIPAPPALYAEPRYIGSHKFVGRRAQLDVLSDWALPADPHPILLFDAIGGSGKSMLTWEWTTNHATRVRGDWAGRFWYSFYERGAIMADFCQHALAYITGTPLDGFKKMKTPELGEKLLHHLQDRPWQLVLDGLERVLVAYHRFDASDLSDEEANRPTDQIAHRDPCAAIRPEDDDLLRAFAAAAPSKILITSRLVPRVLLNQTVQPIPGVLRVPLPGLRPADAESLLRSCGITGTSEAIQNYLKTHCDCHPLVTGVLAGLINDYLPNKGNFDAWSADAAGGGQLNLADLDLIGKRNHILKAAMNNLSAEGRQVLSLLALLSEAVDYPILSALNPYLPPEPDDVEVPDDPKGSLRWEGLSNARKEKAQQAYQAAVQYRKEYERAVSARLQSPEFLAAPQKLASTVRNLERRGLLQYDNLTRRYDLHPVVRAIAIGGLQPEEKDGFGRRVVDHFSAQTHRPYEEAETLQEVHDGLRIVRTLLKMGHYQEAVDIYRGDLAIALLFNLEAHAENLSLLRPFFSQGWGTLPSAVNEKDAAYLASVACCSLEEVGEPGESLAANAAGLMLWLRDESWIEVNNSLQNITHILLNQNRLGKADGGSSLSLDLATLINDKQQLFLSRLDRFNLLRTIGLWADAQALWDQLDPMGRDWERSAYRAGTAESCYACFHFWQGSLNEEHLARAEQLARIGKNRPDLRRLHSLRGEWRLERGEWLLAAESLHEAVSMARAVDQTDASAETQLAFARFQLGQLADPRREAEHLANLKYVSPRDLADLWLAIGDREQAKKYALEVYMLAWADGEPYVHRYALNKARTLLEKLGAEIPNLPAYDPTRKEKFPWEDELIAAIEKLRAKKEAENHKDD
jgi:hypothetical protein